MEPAYGISDTSEKMRRIFILIQRRLPLVKRFHQTLEMNALIDAMVVSSEKRQFPELTDREILLRVARRRLGRELADRIYGN
jgi:hypothetical protein